MKIKAIIDYGLQKEIAVADVLQYIQTCKCEGDNHPCTSCSYDEGYNDCIEKIKKRVCMVEILDFLETLKPYVHNFGESHLTEKFDKIIKDLSNEK